MNSCPFNAIAAARSFWPKQNQNQSGNTQQPDIGEPEQVVAMEE